MIIVNIWRQYECADRARDLTNLIVQSLYNAFSR